MKKILWVCNVPIPRIANAMNVTAPNICGWLTGFANSLEKNHDIDLHICFPLMGIKEVKSGKVGNLSYYAFSQPKVMGILPAEDQLHTSPEMVSNIKQIIETVKPDILHIFGTEYPHSLVAAEEFNNPLKTIVNIQGLTSFYWMHFNSGIPYSDLKRFAISNIARGNLIKQSEKLKERGEFEIKTLRKVGHVIGRTDWDEACTTQVNPDVEYHFCNESLRDSFYTGKWSYEDCEKHSIFMSQAATPIKGLQFMLRSMPEILRAYPDAHLYVAGNDLTRTDSLYAKLKISSFAKYIKKLIRENDLENKVTFTGSLTEQQMKGRFLRSNVFVSPSTIENSPNSLGEAMLLGVPSVSSDVGGVKNLLRHEEEGFVYQGDAPYMLAYYIKKIFANPRLANQLGEKAQKHAQITHDRERNLATLLSIYYDIDLKNRERGKI
ncbi:glycosyltransferase family 4 protein [Neobacillus drentensis]|uniref:glycosyltransferase family 4 protein n=1 Tax=Neobacillus drentensis TaxID=220684 RepID=UPI0030002E38